MSVLIVTKSTGEALVSVLCDPTQIRVEFKGHNDGRSAENLWGEEDMMTPMATSPIKKLEWEDSDIIRYIHNMLDVARQQACIRVVCK